MESTLQTFKEMAERLYKIAIDVHKQSVKEDPGRKELSFQNNLQSLTERLIEIRHHLAYSVYKGNDQEAVFGALGKEVEKVRQRFINEAEKP